MFFSAHVLDSGVLQAVRRRTPKAPDVAGLKSARNGISAPFGKTKIPRPQPSRETMVACWEDEASLDQFLATHPTGQAYADGFTVRMELARAVGVWPGLTDDMDAEAGTKIKGVTGPFVAITIGTAYLKTAVPFLKVNSGLEDQFVDTPSGIWGTAFSNLPQRLVGTLTCWESPQAAVDYMASGAHHQAVLDHYDPAKDPTGHTFVTGGGFFGFRPLSSTGSLDGRNPMAPGLLGV